MLHSLSFNIDIPLLLKQLGKQMLSPPLCRQFTCSKTMPGSLGHEEQDAKTFASWVGNLVYIFFMGFILSIFDIDTTCKYQNNAIMKFVFRVLIIWSMITVTMMEQSQLLGNIVILTLTSQVNGEIYIWILFFFFFFGLAMYVETVRYESIMIHFFLLLDTL